MIDIYKKKNCVNNRFNWKWRSYKKKESRVLADLVENCIIQITSNYVNNRENNIAPLV